jgi:dipeptidyl aminopeptidase/acylaminoacyl peptidase
MISKAKLACISCLCAGAVLGAPIKTKIFAHGTATFSAHRRQEQNGIAEKGAANDPESQTKRPLTVADVIRMTRIAGTEKAKENYGGSLWKDFAFFSPDKKRFVIVLKRGNLEKNENDYSMLLFETGKLFDHAVPKTLVSFASSSNREAINDVTWLGDGDTIMFLGERPNETTQLYTVQCSSGTIRKLTNGKTSINSYAATPEGVDVAYLTYPPAQPLLDKSVSQTGFHVTSELLSELLADSSQVYDQELHVGRVGSGSPKSLKTQGKIAVNLSKANFALSPDGRYVVLLTDPLHVPALWAKYQDPSFREIIARKAPPGNRTYAYQYELVDTQTGRTRFLLDSPVSYLSEVGWAPDSKSLVVTGTYLPLDVSDPAEEAARERGTFTVEISVLDLQFVKVTDRDLEFLGWDAETNVVRMTEREAAHKGPSPEVDFARRRDGGWGRLDVLSDRTTNSAPQIVLDTDLNRPPQIVAVDSKSSQKSILLDLNPQFKEIAFGHVEKVRWKDGADHEVEGGLFLPPDYAEGTRYPLVIQTHGFDPIDYPHLFWIDGPFTTAFAAQPLASEGIVVLQVPDPGPKGDPQEAPLMQKTIGGAIDYLDEKGIIDRNRVGIVGFSRTCLYVKYALTHSTHHFAAAVVADGLDAGYWQYIAFGNHDPSIPGELNALVGSAPYGDGLSTWVRYSPGFLLDRVQSPVLIQAIGSDSLLNEWQWLSGLRILDKPVDLIYLPTGTHHLQKPWDRMVSLQSDVDWFCFWLKGEEDPDPTKVKQYVRWRELKKLQERGDALEGAPK